MKNFRFCPKLFSTVKNYSRRQFLDDLMSGIIVGIVALPLAIAFAIASGVSPEKGIITAIVAGFIVSALGGSKVQIGGPTGAFIVIVFGVVQTYGLGGLMTATMLAGALLVLLGVFRLGTVIKFIPYPVVVGFTSGIALTIFATQIPDVFGLDFGGESVPGDFIGKWALYFRHFDTVNWWSLGISAISVALIILTPRIFRKIPGSLVAILLVTTGVWALEKYAGIDCVETIGDRFTISSRLPALTMPELSWEAIRNLFPISITIAVLAAIESLLSATVADGMIGDKHDSNTELVALGIANFVTPVFGGIPATGAIARTMTNINNGGKTPVAGMVHAVVLLLILLFLMPLAKYIPMACLGGVLVVVSYNMSGWRTFKGLLRNSKSDVAVLLLTFFLTVLFDLTIAIGVGLLIACLLFMERVMETTEISVITDELRPSGESDFYNKDDEALVVPEGVEIYEINGPYFFGVATKFEDMMSRFRNRTKVRIIRMRKVPFIDSTGIHNLTNLCEMSRKKRMTIVLSGVNEKVRSALARSGFNETLGEENICSDIHAALARARRIIAMDANGCPMAR